MADTVKVSANLPAETLELLKALSRQRKTTMTEILRRAIENESFFQEVVAEEGKVLIEDKKGNKKQVLMR